MEEQKSSFHNYGADTWLLGAFSAASFSDSVCAGFFPLRLFVTAMKRRQSYDTRHKSERSEWVPKDALMDNVSQAS